MSVASPFVEKKTGYLVKQSGDSIRKTWKRRYFELEWPYLRYKKDAAEAEWRGELLCDSVILTDDIQGVDRPHSFCALHKDRRPFFLQAESQEEMMEWVHAIRNDPSKVSLIDFEVHENLGEGAYGQVQLVCHRTTHLKYAMKILSKEQTREADAVQLTKLERDILKKARHPFVVHMAYAFQTPEKLYMVMDLVEGGDMYAHMQKHGRFPENVMQVWAAEISLAVGYLHSIGVIFRDLKPENILLDLDGHCRITDFGLAFQVESADQRAHSFCGTPYYVSPELILKCRQDKKERGGYSKDVDWWALGVLCFELVVGSPPFDGRTGQEVYRRIVKLPMDEVATVLEKKGGVSAQAISFVTGLLERDLEKRLGGGQADVHSIREHPFFAKLDWSALERMEVESGFKPQVGRDRSHTADHFARKMQGTAAVEKPKGIFERARRKSLEMIMGENAKPSREQMAALLVCEDSSDDEFEDFSFGGDDAEAQVAAATGGHDTKAGALYKTIRALFDSFDSDKNGYLDSSEVQQFCSTLGVQLTEEEAVAASAEMELETKKDGLVEFDEFMHWFTKKQIGMDPNSIGWRLIEARQRALENHAFEDSLPGSPDRTAKLPEPPADLVPVKSFRVKHSKAKVAISVDGEGLHIMENHTNKCTSFPLSTLKTWHVIGKKCVVIGLVDAHDLSFDTKEAEVVSQTVQKAVMARLAWLELHKTTELEPEPERGPEPEPEPEPERGPEPEPEPEPEPTQKPKPELVPQSDLQSNSRHESEEFQTPRVEEGVPPEEATTATEGLDDVANDVVDDV